MHNRKEKLALQNSIFLQIRAMNSIPNFILPNHSPQAIPSQTFRDLRVMRPTYLPHRADNQRFSLNRNRNAIPSTHLIDHKAKLLKYFLINFQKLLDFAFRKREDFNGSHSQTFICAFGHNKIDCGSSFAFLQQMRLEDNTGNLLASDLALRIALKILSPISAISILLGAKSEWLLVIRIALSGIWLGPDVFLDTDGD